MKTTKEYIANHLTMGSSEKLITSDDFDWLVERAIQMINQVRQDMIEECAKELCQMCYDGRLVEYNGMNFYHHLQDANTDYVCHANQIRQLKEKA